MAIMAIMVLLATRQTPYRQILSTQNRSKAAALGICLSLKSAVPTTLHLDFLYILSAVIRSHLLI